MSQQFAVFDIDGTLIRWQLYHAIVHELAKRGHLSKDAAKVIHESQMTWKNRTHRDSFREYENTVVKIYYDALTHLKVSDYLATIDHVFDMYKEQTYTYTRDLIKELKAKDYCLIAISGSQQEILDKMAVYYGFDIAVGAVHEQKDGYFSGSGTTTIHKKDVVLRNLMKEHQLSEKGSLAVGDSEGDISMLEIVAQPIAFNPSQKLFTHAQRAGWKIVIERKNMVYELESRDGTYLLAQTNS